MFFGAATRSTQFSRVLCLLILFPGCGTEPTSEELEAARQELNQSRITDPQTYGQCNNRKDRLVIRPDHHNFAEAWNNYSSLGGLDTDRLHRDFPSVTKDCINCFGVMTACAVSNCKSKCAPPIPIIGGYGAKSIECRTCTHNACGAKMIECSGLLPEEWPDFKRI